MAKSIFCLLMTVALSATSGCATPPKSGKGFTLPEGDAQAGKANYVSLQCNACHKIDGVDQIAAGSGEPEHSIVLGGEVTRIETYGELVTSIINPSHRLAKGYPVEAVSVDGKSKMKNYNDAMTVTQLTDLVAFVQSKYRLLEYELTDYPMYGPP
jgi:sulfur-oxidizing protein SoxX